MSLAIAFIGVGTMGGPMARRLLRAGNALAVCDRRQAASGALGAEGAAIATSPSAAAGGVDIAFTCLPDEGATQEVYFGPGGLRECRTPPRVVIDVSTIGPASARRLSAAVAASGSTFLDAPVSGGAAAAAKGTLTAIVAGDRAAVATAHSTLATLASDIFVVGDTPGQAQIVKLINNVLSYTALAATSEALMTGRMAGIDVPTMVRALNKGTGRSSATDSKIPDEVLSRRFAYGASNRISRKDLSLYLDVARGLSVPTPITAQVSNLLQMWMRGREDEDMTSIARLFEGWSGAELAASPESDRAPGWTNARLEER